MNLPTSTLMILSSLGFLQAAPPQPTVTTRVAQGAAAVVLPRSARNKLKSLGIPIAVPTYLPSRYEFETVITEPCRPGEQVNDKGVCRFGPTYSIVYSNDDQSCFVVEATGGGIGGVASDYIHSFSIPLFSQETSVSFGKLGLSGGLPKRATASDLRKTYDVVYGDWLGTSPFYRVSNFYPKSVRGCISRRGLTPLEAQKVTQSLRWLP